MELTVEPLDGRDAGRGLAAVDDAAAGEAGLSAGDFVTVDGPLGSVVARLWPGYPRDEGRGVVRLDERLRRQTGVELEGTATVARTEPPRAERVTVGFSQRLWLRGDADRALRGALVGQPVSVGQTLPVTVRSGFLGFRRETPVVEIVDTEPDGPVVVDEETVVQMGGAVGIDLLEAAARDERLALLGATAEVDGEDHEAVVRGEVRNVGDQVLDRVTAEATFYRDDEATYHLGTRARGTGGFRPGKVWPFEVTFEYGDPDRRPRSCELVVGVE